jgi:hypothetical protein
LCWGAPVAKVVRRRGKLALSSQSMTRSVYCKDKLAYGKSCSRDSVVLSLRHRFS